MLLQNLKKMDNVEIFPVNGNFRLIANKLKNNYDPGIRK